MGKIKYLSYIESLFEKSPVVNYSSVKRMIVGKGGKSQYAKMLLHNLLKKGKIKKLSKGHYTKLNDSSLIVFSMQPAYLGLQDSLSHYNLWEQETIPVIITTKKSRQGVRKVLGANVLVKRINKKYYFGIDYFQENNLALPYSDLEKTFIDMVYFRQNISNELVKSIKKVINLKKLNMYLKVYPKSIKDKICLLLGKKELNLSI